MHTYIRRIKDVLGYVVIVNILIEFLCADDLGTTLLVLLNVLEGHEGIVLASIVINVHLFVAATRIIFLIRLPRNILLLQQINNRITINVGFIVLFGSFGGSADESNL